MKTFLSNLEWRFATKKFDPEKTVDKEDLEKILRAIRYSPSSFGLQPYHIYVISDREIKQRIKKHAMMQSQVTDSRYLLVFCARVDVNKRISSYIDLASDGSATKKLLFQPLKIVVGRFLKNNIPKEGTPGWTTRQAYIALGFALAACAELLIDSCPMEGFNAKKVDETLGVPEHLKSVVLLAIGYRKGEPEHKKVRFPNNDLFTHL